MSAAPTKDARLDLRLTAHQKRTLERAAELSGSTVAGFAVTHLMQDAAEVIERSRTLVLDEDDWDTFVAALDAPDGSKWTELRTRARPWDRE